MEMVSGPDVGGGFLFQLTTDPRGENSLFTIHAQEGGLDGGEPTAGTPEHAGFEIHEGMCPVGGRQCWHREFELNSSEALRVRFAYNRLRFVMGSMLRQSDPAVTVPFDSGLREVVKRVVGPMRDAGEPWFIGGSAAPAILGARVEPRDLDLGTTRRGVQIIAEALGEYLIEPPARSDWGSASAWWGARAFVGTFKDGIRAEWAEARPGGSPRDGPEYEWSRPSLDQSVPSTVDEWPVRVAPPEIALVKSLHRGDERRTTAILELFRASRADRALFDQLVDGYTTDPATREAWKRRFPR
ncbi:MAG TPA: hypothetical protein VEY07_00120 [Thermoplasmata archaeon]|nr:hypothetical protein [Thermoplasmata archaeon]